MRSLSRQRALRGTSLLLHNPAFVSQCLPITQLYNQPPRSFASQSTKSTNAFSNLSSRVRSQHSTRTMPQPLIVIQSNAKPVNPCSFISSSSAMRSSIKINNKRFYTTSSDSKAIFNEKIRNVAIIAHVDHGKTSLVDKLLTQSGSAAFKGERVMDSNALEQERGITILAKQTSVQYKDYTINIVDTPGHGDFGGEVERIMNMVDGVVMLVDATEGPMTQTKYVLSKALANKLKPIVVLNKMDRDTIRVDQVENELFDLFVALEATDEQLDYVTLYASARQGWAVRKRTDPKENMIPLFEAILEQVPPPRIDPDAPFAMLVTNLEYDMHLGRLLIGRIRSGSVRPNDVLHGLSREGKELEQSKVLKLLGRRGLERIPLPEGRPGDIVGIAGFSACSVTDTICAPAISVPIPANPIDPPVLSIVISVNDSPLAGREGTKLNSSQLRQRLMRELESNVTIQVVDIGREASLEVRGRGELQLSILIENMRREGFELSISPPKVIYKHEQGEVLEPIEEVTLDVASEYSGTIMERLALRKGELQEMKQDGTKSRIIFYCPSRSLVGFRSELNQMCRGSVVLNHLFHSYAPFKGEVETARKGALVSNAAGTTTTYALAALEARGVLFVGPGVDVYMGMIVGENAKKGDMDVNPVRAKQLSNMRTTLKEEAVRLTPPRIITLEEAITYIAEDELVEVTPGHVRLRKEVLDTGLREQMARKKKKSAA
jgi:GTP-binding protein